MHHDAVTSDSPSSAVRDERERNLVMRCGVFVAFVGLALHQLENDRVMVFLSSAMVITGVLMALPQLVAQAVEKSRT